MDTIKIAKLVRAGIASSSTRDVIAGSFMSYSILESFARKEKEKFREDIFATSKSLDKIHGVFPHVEKTGNPESLFLFKGKEYSVSSTVRQGKTFTDMEILRLSLSVPADAWETAVRMAAHRRNPEILLQVSRL